MTKTYRVTLWDHSWFATTVRARSEHEAFEKAQFRYGGASPAECVGFELLENHSDDWEVRPVTPRPRRRP